MSALSGVKNKVVLMSQEMFDILRRFYESMARNSKQKTALKKRYTLYNESGIPIMHYNHNDDIDIPINQGRKNA